MDTKKFQDEYQDKLASFEQLETVALYQLDKAIKEKKIKIHLLDHRVKKPLSLFNKAQEKRVEDPFDQIHDIIGLRVVCLFLSDIEKIRNILANNFIVIEEEDKMKSTDPNIFGFLGINFTVKLKNVPKGLILKNFLFEIQVETISQNTWAVISHDLDYKSSKPIQQKYLRRDFYALSGLLHVADSHFDYLRKQLEG